MVFTATAVVGRKIMVSRAMDFIAELASMVAWAKFVLTRPSFNAMQLWSCVADERAVLAAS